MEPHKQLFKEYEELYKNFNMCIISCIRSLKCSFAMTLIKSFVMSLKRSYTSICGINFTRSL